MYIVVSQCTPVLYTLDIHYAYQTFEKISKEVFDGNEDSMRSNKDYYVTHTEFDIINPAMIDFETPKDLKEYMENNGLLNH